MTKCPLCGGKTFKTICEFKGIPVFQNKVYPTEKEAKKAITGDVVLMQCCVCGFVFNREFNDQLMNYNSMYQNEQAHSEYFKSYLLEVIKLLKSEGFLSGKIVEIGCGKGSFLELLLQDGRDAIGFDPAYEGKNSRIIKDYFSDSYKMIKADAIILRHTLEHIQEPLNFLHAIGTANGYRGKIYIEVPCFDWIRRKNSFWDIYHEHCNYFTIETLKAMFTESS
ncbi:MAG: class I SAM-dependent methyltransferase, partial [Deltaproteobacteria bacterium]|nr:class I SAM-dependent methyltransferase [Deltaproteobacteria bacterium]